MLRARSSVLGLVLGGLVRSDRILGWPLRVPDGLQRSNQHCVGSERKCHIHTIS